MLKLVSSESLQNLIAKREIIFFIQMILQQF